MLEAQEIERFGFPFSSSFPVLFGKPAEFDPARLIRVQFQSEFSQSLSQVIQKAIRVRLLLESDDGIVCVAHDYHLALRPFLAPDVHPEVEAVVQVNVREQR